MVRLKLDFQEALKKPIQDITNPEVWRQISGEILQKIRIEAEKWNEFRARSLEKARVTFIR